ncbi:MAG: protein kinase [Planctomycetaceae bacterium]|nr:protein kinase [Planctomycetaceae bacterium]
MSSIDSGLRNSPDENVENGLDPTMVEPVAGQQNSEAGHDDLEVQRSPVIGPYKLLQRIGEGGMGTVYMAEQSHPVVRRVALKLIKPGMDSRQVIARFEAERQALAMMDHPNIARVLDAGTTESQRPYFVMELVRGIPITEYCDLHNLTVQERLELFIPVCQAVQHAHLKGVIHRDLKPSNILVASYDDVSVPKVIDFGLAKAMHQKLTDKTMFTAFGQVVGTLQYMSPEQTQHNQLDIDTRSDIYSLGVILYELLTGDVPLQRERVKTTAFDELLRLVREEEPARPSIRLSTDGTLPAIAARRKAEPTQLGRLVRGELDWIVLKSLEKDRVRRYETANALAEDLRRHLADEPVSACPPSTAYQLKKLWHRNRVLIRTLSLLFTALTVGLIVASWQAYRATKAEDLAFSREQAANASAEKSKRSLAQARKAVDQLLTRIGEDRLSGVPNSEKIRQEILGDALEIYQELLNENSDDPELLAETARAYARMAEIYVWVGKAAEGDKANNRAIKLYEELLRIQEDNLAYQFELAQCLTRYLHPSRFDAGVKIARELVEQEPANANYVSFLIDKLVTKGAHVEINRSRDQALSTLKEAIDLGEAFGPDPQVRLSLADAYGWYAGHGGPGPNREEEILEELLSQDPASRAVRVALASFYAQKAQRPDPEAATRALDLYESLHRDFPDVYAYKQGLALALIFLPSDDSDERVRAVERSYELTKATYEAAPNSTNSCWYHARHAGFLANTRWNQGRLDEAETLFLESIQLRKRVQELGGSSSTVKECLWDSWRLGDLYKQQNRNSEAIAVYLEQSEVERSLIESDFDDEFVWRNCNECYEWASALLTVEGRITEAIAARDLSEEIYERRLSKVDDTDVIRLRIGNLRELMSLQFQAAARPDGSDRLQKAIDAADAYFGMVQSQVKNFPAENFEMLAKDVLGDEAIAQFTHVLALSPVWATELGTKFDSQVVESVIARVEEIVSADNAEIDLREFLTQARTQRLKLIASQHVRIQEPKDALRVLLDGIDNHLNYGINIAALQRMIWEDEALFESFSELGVDKYRSIWHHRADLLAGTERWREAQQIYHLLGETYLEGLCALLSGDLRRFTEIRDQRLEAVRVVTPQPVNEAMDAATLAALSQLDDAQRMEMLVWTATATKANDLVRFAFGVSLLRAGLFAEAIPVLSHPSGYSPNDDYNYQSIRDFPLAIAYRAIGDMTASREHFEAGITKLKLARPGESPAVWSPVHWLNVQSWRKIAQQYLEDPASFAEPLDESLTEKYRQLASLFDPDAVTAGHAYTSLLQDPALSDAKRLVLKERLLTRLDVIELSSELLPEDVLTRRERADEFARRKMWVKAAEFYDDYPLMKAFCLVLSGDLNSYEEMCRIELESLKETRRPATNQLRLSSDLVSMAPNQYFNPDQSLAWIEEAHEKAPSKFTLETMATVLYRAGRYREAIETIQQLLQRDDAVASSVAFQLAMSHHAVGDMAEAKRWFDIGQAELAAAVDADGRATWALTHWATVNLYHAEAEKIFATNGDSIED